jgi:hypothetical protein
MKRTLLYKPLIGLALISLAGPSYAAVVIRRVLQAGLVAAIGIGLSGCGTSQGAIWPAFGTYRMPYNNGIEAKVWQDFETHSPLLGRYDLKALDNAGIQGGPYPVVAAADGWIRKIEDSNSGGDEVPNNYVWMEHPYPFCQADGVTWPGKPANYDDTCIPCASDFCNEWTKYSHLVTNSVTVDATRAEDDFVRAGALLGFEGGVGARKPHLHWEVAKLDPADPIDDDGFAKDWSSGGWVGSPNLLPSICGGIGIMDQGETYMAAPCVSPEAASGGMQDIAVSVRGTWLGRSVAASGRLKFSALDRQNRMTLSTFALDGPVSLDATTYGATPSSQVSASFLRQARMIRPVTFTIGRDGNGRFPAD